MYKKIIVAGFTIMILSIATPSLAKEPRNLDLVKQSLIKYHDSGEYAKDQAKVIDKAMIYLKARLASEKKSPSDKKFALVLDIDETALSNYQDMVVMNFGGTLKEINEAEAKGDDPAIQPTLELYKYAKNNNVAVFFVTGRKANVKEQTTKNLNDAGYKNYDGLTFKPEDYNNKSATPYKIAARQDIEKQGYKIILNIGDQESDLAGKHADKTFKLPNPYYFIP